MPFWAPLGSREAEAWGPAQPQLDGVVLSEAQAYPICPACLMGLRLGEAQLHTQAATLGLPILLLCAIYLGNNSAEPMKPLLLFFGKKEKKIELYFFYYMLREGPILFRVLKSVSNWSF